MTATVMAGMAVPWVDAITIALLIVVIVMLSKK